VDGRDKPGHDEKTHIQALGKGLKILTAFPVRHLRVTAPEWSHQIFG
jgi:hypothetical protein